VRDDAHASTVLRSLAQGRTLLFVGCGDTVSDPNFARLIQWAKAALDDVAPHHFLLCRQSERRAFQNKLRQAPWLQPLAYGDDYADLLPFLQSLARPPGLLRCRLLRKRRPQANLPSHSLGQLFLGREALLTQLHTQLGARPCGSHAPAVLAVLHGLGGMGKTRLALEYAWRHADTYGALLLVDADSPEALQRNLAPSPATRLNLPAQHETDEARQRAAVLQWLGTHPGWLLILDNADSEAAAAAGGPAAPARWRPPDRHQPDRPVERRHPDWRWRSSPPRPPPASSCCAPRASAGPTRTPPPRPPPSPQSSTTWPSPSNRPAPTSPGSASASASTSKSGAISSKRCSSGTTRA
jgi:hypothetical protein